MSDSSLDRASRRQYRQGLVRLAIAFLVVAAIAVTHPALPPVYLGLSFTQWHTVLETISIVLCGLVFGVCWNSFSVEQPRALLLLGCASLGSMILDVVHTLSFEGMPDLITPNGYGKAFLLYFAARLLIAIALLAVALWPWRAREQPAARGRLLAGVLAYATFVIWAILFEPEYVPLMETRNGSVPFHKLIAQGALVVLFAAAGLAFWRRMFRERDIDGVALFEASMLAALGELCFTQVGRLTDAALMVGHVLKVLAFIRVYRAIFVQGIQWPYQRLAASREQLRKSENHLRTVTDNLPALIAYVDNNLIYRFANRKYETWLGVKIEDVVGRPLAEIVGRRHAAALTPRLKRALAGETITYDYQFRKRGEDSLTWLNITYMPRRAPDGSVDGLYVLTLDVTQRRVAEDHAAYIARHDELTGLPNRLALKDALNAMLAPGRSLDPHFAILFLDLDRFKTVNDTLGHDAGDRLLITVAKRLRASVRDDDLVARMGGDEMCVLLRAPESIEYVTEVASRVRDQLKLPVELAPGLSYKVTVSIGIAMYPRDGADGDTLLKNADIAMYQAKGSGRDQVRFFQLAAEGVARRRLELELCLQTALARDEMMLMYQPILSVTTRKPVGAEALVRWNHPTLGVLGPSEFIGVAEEMGLVSELGEWVLNEASKALCLLDRRGSGGLFMAVNISARQFQSPNLISSLRASIARHGLEADRIHLELTESAMMDDPEEARGTMQQLKAAGVRLSVDDFGTGYSSLAHLKRFPVDTVKIDASFIAELPESRDDAALAAAIISMGHSLSLDVVAEGVETEAQLAFLAQEGCRFFQGYLESAPVSLDALMARLDAYAEDGPALRPARLASG